MINKELLIERYQGGIKLTAPLSRQSELHNKYTLGSLLNLPISFYLLDLAGNTQQINEEGVIVCGFGSVKESLGKSIIEVGIKESAEQLIKNCHEVIILNTTKIFEEKHILKNGEQYQFLTVKCPWLNENNKIIGICGFSMVLGKHPIAESLSFIKELGLLNQPTPLPKNPQLTKREIDCLPYIMRGFTAKRIAYALNISFRTVEEYIKNIREKFGAPSKAHLIEMVLDNYPL